MILVSVFGAKRDVERLDPSDEGGSEQLGLADGMNVWHPRAHFSKY
jgi:hypothetical protein